MSECPTRCFVRFSSGDEEELDSIGNALFWMKIIINGGGWIRLVESYGPQTFTIWEEQ